MSSRQIPTVGSWYMGPNEECFEVLDVDEEENCIEIQYDGGDIDELDFDSWYAMELQKTSPPDDWTAAYDQVEREDRGYSDMAGDSSMQTFRVEDYE